MKTLLIFISLSFLLISCSKDDTPKRQWGDNPLKQNKGDTVFITLESKSMNNTFGNYQMVFLYSSQPMDDDVTFTFSIKFNFRNKVDTINCLIPYQFNKWLTGTSFPAPTNSTYSDVRLIKVSPKTKTYIYNPI